MTKLNPSYVGIRSDLLTYIKGTDLTVLDVGCATGANGAQLLEQQLAKEVYGIEFDHEMVKIARQSNTKVYQVDLNNLDALINLLPNLPEFDYIIFGDVLEHLYNPWSVLELFAQRLSESGSIVISLPNVAHLELFLQVFVKGSWPRNERGIFDKTHIRWFTKKDVVDLVESAGLKILRYEHKYRSRDAIGSRFTWPYRVLKKINKNWVTFQHIVICEHK